MAVLARRQKRLVQRVHRDFAHGGRPPTFLPVTQPARTADAEITGSHFSSRGLRQTHKVLIQSVVIILL